jgi:hypothetical protein
MLLNISLYECIIIYGHQYLNGRQHYVLKSRIMELQMGGVGFTIFFFKTKFTKDTLSPYAMIWGICYPPCMIPIIVTLAWCTPEVPCHAW